MGETKGVWPNDRGFPPEVTGEAKVCRSCSLTIVTELAHDMGKWSLPSSSLSSFSKS